MQQIVKERAFGAKGFGYGEENLPGLARYWLAAEPPQPNARRLAAFPLSGGLRPHCQCAGQRPAGSCADDYGQREHPGRHEIRWERNRGVENLGHPRIKQRDTDRGDLIVDPQGRAYRVEKNGFSEIVRGNGREACQKLLAEKAAVVSAKDHERGIER
jgi:hypothetical protein